MLSLWSGPALCLLTCGPLVVRQQDTKGSLSLFSCDCECQRRRQLSSIPNYTLTIPYPQTISTLGHSIVNPLVRLPF